jgi:type II secretory pathway component PulF
MEWFLYSWPTLILLGLALRMAVRITYGARGAEPGDPIYVFLHTSALVLIGLGILPAVLGGTATLVGGILGLLAVTTFVEVVVYRRVTQRRSMAKMLALLVERGRQLDSSVLFAGQALRGIVGRAADRLLAELGRGASLVEAVAKHPRALPPEALAYVAAGQTADAQAAALRELCRGDEGEMAAAWRACIDRIAYLAFILMIMATVLTFIMIKIVPDFQNIFEEFDIELPQMTWLAIMVTEFFTQYAAAPVIMASAIFLLGSLLVGICYLCDIPLLRPWTDMLFFRRRSAHVLRILSVATEAREPLAEVLRRVTGVFPSDTLRHRLRPVVAAVRGGADWRDALMNAGIISHSERALLNAAERAGNLPWALRQIAMRREKRAVYRLMAAVQVLFPIAILAFAMFVAFFVVSLFIPLVKLIDALTG